MSDIDPTAPGAPPLPDQTLQIPLVLLANCQLRIDTLPDGMKMVVIGPVALGLPLNPGAEKWLHDQMNSTGIIVAGPSMMDSI